MYIDLYHSWVERKTLTSRKGLVAVSLCKVGKPCVLLDDGSIILNPVMFTPPDVYVLCRSITARSCQKVNTV